MRSAQASRQVGGSNATLRVRVVRDMSDNMRLGRAERCRPNSSPQQSPHYAQSVTEAPFAVEYGPRESTPKPTAQESDLSRFNRACQVLGCR